MHFANCQGYIQDAVFIGSITSKTFAARKLGSTEAKADLILPNELEFSLSANDGLTFRTDVEPRTRKIALEFGEENANGRVFKNPRPARLGARASRPAAERRRRVRGLDGGGLSRRPTPFNSFPEWAGVVGGILHAGGLGDPCLPHHDDGRSRRRPRERAMRALYALCFERIPSSGSTRARSSSWSPTATTTTPSAGSASFAEERSARGRT